VTKFASHLTNLMASLLHIIASKYVAAIVANPVDYGTRDGASAWKGSLRQEIL